MQHLPAPAGGNGALYAACVAKRPDPPRTALEEMQQEVTGCAAEYNQRSLAGEIHGLHASQIIAGSAVKIEVRNLYDACLIRGRHRKTYDNQRLLALNGLCPMCGVGRVYTLDHYLPRAQFPEFSVEPLNLVPSCRDCNTKKANHLPNQRDETLFHPFFDDWSNVTFIKVDLECAPRVRARYSVFQPLEWDYQDVARAVIHFQLLGLAELYEMNAGSELAGMKRQFESVAASGIPNLKAFLEEITHSRTAVSRNSWQARLYAALSESEEFCGGAFQNIGL